MDSFRFSIVAGADLGKKLQKAGLRIMPLLRREIHQSQLRLRLAARARVKALFRRHTGNLERSIVIEPIVETGTNVVGRVGTAIVYGRVQELGGTIKPKNVRHLTIPLQAMLTSSGVARSSAHEVISSPGTYGWAGTFTRKNIVFGKKDGGSFSPLFLLRDSVTLKPHPYMEPSAVEESPIFGLAISSAMASLLPK